MIWATRLNGSEIIVNADLIETIESTPDTVLTLVDGKKYVIHESPDEIVARIQAFRASVLALVDSPLTRPAEPGLYVLPSGDDEV